MKKSLSLLLVLTFLFVICGSVNAQEIASSETPYSRASNELINIFEDAGYSVPNNATFSLIPVASGKTSRSLNQTSDMALCMTTKNGNEITKTVILSIGIDEENNLRVDNEPTYLLRAQPRFSFPVTLSNKVRISGTATYTTTSKNAMLYIKPQSCSFSYGRTAAGSSSSVIYAGVSYYIKGNRYSDDVYSDHTINCTRNYPTEGITYSNSNPAPDYYVPIGGHILTYMCTVDGAYDSFVVSI